MQIKNKALFKVAAILLCSVFTTTTSIYAQDNMASGAAHKDTTAMGVAISPGKLSFNCKPGNSQSQIITITNNTEGTYNFKTGFTDFSQSTNGRPLFNAQQGAKNKYSLSKWATATPAFFTLEPGKAQKITVTVTIPNNDSNNIAAWTIMEVDQVKKKQQLTQPNGEKTISMGVSPEIGLGAYIYQNPPNVKINNVIIDRFYYRDTIYNRAGKPLPEAKQLWLQISNVGDGISYCISYAELTNLQTGKKTRLNTVEFNILPGFDRES